MFQSIEEDTEMTTVGIFVGLIEGEGVGLSVFPAIGLVVGNNVGLEEGGQVGVEGSPASTVNTRSSTSSHEPPRQSVISSSVRK
jgi:hypothetical protein